MRHETGFSMGVVAVDAVGRRRFTPEFKRQLVEQTLRPGASVAGIALAHQINANQLFKWRREYLQPPAIRPDTSPVLLPVEVVAERPPKAAAVPPEPAPIPLLAGSIDIELGSARVRVSGTVDPTVLRTVLISLGG